MKLTFYPHQLISISNMQKLEEDKSVNLDNTWIVETTLGFLSDPNGSGKTLSMAGLIKQDKMHWDLSTPYTARRFTASTDKRNIISYYKVETYEKINSTLIISNPSVISHWESELQKLDLKVLKITSKKDIDFTSSLNRDLDNIDVVLICSTVYNNVASRCEVEYKAWKRIIFDEPHGKPPVLLPITGGFYWIISANITDVYTGIKSGFIRDIFDQFSQDVLNKIMVKNTPDTIKKSFELPPVIKKYYECYQPILNTVKGFVSDKVAEMISAGNIIGAVKELDGQITDNIAQLVKSKKEKELESITDPIKREKILDQMKEIDNKYKEALVGPCLICFDDIENPVMETCCQNIFCSKCIFKLLENNSTSSCPICRSNIDGVKSLVFIDTNNIINTDIKPSRKERLPTKQQELINIINRLDNDSKIIVYSTWDESFTVIRKVLEQNNISYSEVKGNIPSRIKILDAFKTGKIKVIFLNSNHSGSGLNLQETTDVIIYHNSPDDNMITQAIGRANRIGRKFPLTCHILS